MTTVRRIPFAIEGLRASADLSGATFRRTKPEVEDTPLDAPSRRYLEGLLRQEWSGEGGFDSAKAREYLALFQGRAARFVLALSNLGPPGTPAIFGALEVFSHEQRHDVGERMGLDLSGSQNERTFDGLVGWNSFYDGGTDAAGVGVALELGAVGPGRKVVAQAQAVGPIGGTDPTCQLRLASDTTSAFAAPNEQLVFDFAADPGAQQLEKTGEITDTWWRFEVTLGGTDPSFILLAAVAIVTG